MPLEFGQSAGVVPKKGPKRRVTPHTAPKVQTRDKIKAKDSPQHPQGLLVVISAIDGVTPASLFKDLPNNAFYFQCPPLDSLPRDKDWNWDDFGTIGSGMHSNPNYPGLPSVTFETLLVDESWGWSPGPRLVAHAADANGPDAAPYAATPGDALSRQVVPGPRWAVADLANDPLWAVRWLEALGDTMTPFALQWGQPQLWGGWDRVTAATLRSLHVEERAGEIDTRYLRVTFTEYPDADAVAAPAPNTPGRRHGSGGHHSKLLVPPLDSSRLPTGQRTLAQLAKNYYGSASAWRLIAKASGLKNVTANQDLPSTVGKRHPPAKISIPRRPTSPSRPAKQRPPRVH